MTDGHFINNTASGSEPESERTPSQVRTPSRRWRVVDIAVASVIVRKPGAAVYAELVAAILESLLGSLWVPVETILIGLLQGFMAELVFMLLRYRRWNMSTVALSGAAAGFGCWLYSFCTHLQAINLTGPYGVIYLIATLISGALIAGVLVWYLYKAIAATGALDRFASGRDIRTAGK